MAPTTPRSAASALLPSRLGSARVTATTFVVGFAAAYLLGQLAPSPAGPGSPSGLPPGTRQCHRRTREGLCVGDVFGVVDDVYREQWPGSVDLLIRSSVAGRFFLVETLLESVGQMWPKNIGEVVLVLNAGEEEAIALVPTWVKVFFEKNSMGLPARLVQQWSYAWADQYTTADYVAITDDDVVFSVKVTPALLFNLTEGRPFLIGSNRDQRKVWVPSTEFFVGSGRYAANFMVQLPLVVPRGAFAKYREHVREVHRGHQGRKDYNHAFLWFAKHAHEHGRFHIQHCALGNFLYHFMPDQMHFVMEWTFHIPIPRVTVHVPWTDSFQKAAEYKENYPRYSTLYVEEASRHAQEGLCLSFPEGALPGCSNFERAQGQAQVWRYAFDWEDWQQLLFKRDGNGTLVHDRHLQELHCVYSNLARLVTSQRWSMATRESVVGKLRGCVHAPL